MASDDASHSPDTATPAESVSADDAFLLALDTWTDYVTAAEQIVIHAVSFMESRYNEPDGLRLIRMEESFIARAEEAAALLRPEVESGFPTVHAHALLGLCGALESYVEDVILAELLANPSHLSRPAFEKIKVPVSILELPVAARNRRILQEASRATSADLASGVTRHERMLKLVDLSGVVPERIRDAVFLTTEIRNVWAHRGGIADERFLDKCPKLGFPLGQKVAVQRPLFGRLMHGLTAYAWVIANRYLDRHRYPRLAADFVGYEGVFSEVPEASG